MDIAGNWILFFFVKYSTFAAPELFTWQPFWIQNGHNSKPTMDINSQHHNLLIGTRFVDPPF
jgi:hypothetical protein